MRRLEYVLADEAQEYAKEYPEGIREAVVAAFVAGGELIISRRKKSREACSKRARKYYQEHKEEINKKNVERYRHDANLRIRVSELNRAAYQRRKRLA